MRQRPGGGGDVAVVVVAPASVVVGGRVASGGRGGRRRPGGSGERGPLRHSGDDETVATAVGVAPVLVVRSENPLPVGWRPNGRGVHAGGHDGARVGVVWGTEPRHVVVVAVDVDPAGAAGEEGGAGFESASASADAAAERRVPDSEPRPVCGARARLPNAGPDGTAGNRGRMETPFRGGCVRPIAIAVAVAVAVAVAEGHRAALGAAAVLRGRGRGRGRGRRVPLVSRLAPPGLQDPSPVAPHVGARGVGVARSGSGGVAGGPGPASTPRRLQRGEVAGEGGSVPGWGGGGGVGGGGGDVGVGVARFAPVLPVEGLEQRWHGRGASPRLPLVAEGPEARGSAGRRRRPAAQDGGGVRDGPAAAAGRRRRPLVAPGPAVFPAECGPRRERGRPHHRRRGRGGATAGRSSGGRPVAAVAPPSLPAPPRRPRPRPPRGGGGPRRGSGPRRGFGRRRRRIPLRRRRRGPRVPPPTGPLRLRHPPDAHFPQRRVTARTGDERRGPGGGGARFAAVASAGAQAARAGRRGPAGLAAGARRPRGGGTGVVRLWVGSTAGRDAGSTEARDGTGREKIKEHDGGPTPGEPRLSSVARGRGREGRRVPVRKAVPEVDWVVHLACLSKSPSNFLFPRLVLSQQEAKPAFQVAESHRQAPTSGGPTRPSLRGYRGPPRKFPVLPAGVFGT